MQENDSRFTLETLRQFVAERELAPALLLPVGQLRIASIPSQEAIAACRNHLLDVNPEILAEWLRPLGSNPRTVIATC
jgi:hypothetical protein